jgi:putative SOS response-associated peptidase YedK
MCSRYELNARPRDMMRRFDLMEEPPDLSAAEVRPTDRALAVDAGRRPLVLRWGLPAAWDGKPLINARAETLEEKKTFRPLLENRCLIPASAWFEWRRDGKNRLKNRITAVDGRLMAFAGLTDGENFTIVTCAPLAAIAHIHDRMPVVLGGDTETAWLDPTVVFADVAPLLFAYAGTTLNAFEEIPSGFQPDLFA